MVRKWAWSTDNRSSYVKQAWRIDSGVCLRQIWLLDCLWKGGSCTRKGETNDRVVYSSNLQKIDVHQGFLWRPLSWNFGWSECDLPSPDRMRMSTIPGVVQWDGKQWCRWADFLPSIDAGGVTLRGVTLVEEPDCPWNWLWRSIEAQRGVGGEAADGGEFGKWTPACQLVLLTVTVTLTEDEEDRISFITEWILSTGLPQRPWRGSQQTLSQTKSVEGTRFDYEKLSASPDPEGRRKLLSGCGWEIPLLLPRTPSRLDKRELAFLWFGGLKVGNWKLWRIVLGLAKDQRAELEKPKLGFRPEG